ncbi:folate-binding protein [Gulosibacter macacae]|uniref:Folate-binding protein n=1 Tax=Gulosibacter macacae TaxID=2488791 RepID=A0A3P3VZ26_9MICO|nr:folate-binding protein [Gulosibacter macacae]RRJ87507.1 folate-binding protein [Gulosibacter macacae]
MTHSPFLDLPGAIAGVAPDAGVPAHYGAPMPEQRKLDRGRAVVDGSHLGVVRIAGEDRISWIDSLTSQRLVAGADGATSAETLLLNQQGRIEYALDIIDDGTAAYLIVEPDAAEPVAAWFHKMRFRMRVEVTDVSDEFFAVTTIAPSFDDQGLDVGAVAPNGVPLIWTDPWATGAPGGANYAAVAPDSHPGRTFRRRIHLLDAAGRAALVARVRAGELDVAGALALEALRVAAWRPRAATEFDDRILPHELDLLRSSVHLSKGCYRGQETVAKVHNLGHPPRRLTLLDLDGIDGRLPGSGALVRLAEDAAGKPVGRVTSSVRHYDEGPIALALLKRNVATDAALVVDLEVAEAVEGAAADESTAGAPEQLDAHQTVIVRPDAGHSVDIPRFRR